ncbi:MAG TPA: fumarylacetoacetate hydrolase family protein [Alphaproteobacteria bacterium]
MKLVRYGRRGREKPGLIDADGKLRDLSGKIADITPETLSEKGLARLARLSPRRLPLVRGRPRLGVPWTGIGKVMCIGLNYADHAKEAGQPIPAEPILFLKANSAINGPFDEVMLPRASKKGDWEVELGVVIGKLASNVSKRAALDHVAGYTIVNDVSEREFQLERGPTWTKGKSCDTFGPIGPWLVTRDEIPNPQRLGMWLDVNGVRRQTGNTRTMIFGCAELISYLSAMITLYPGDVISTGTPPGVGAGFKPPVFLKPGDVMALGIDGLGAQRQKVVAYKKP